jgi:hypothetical protein
MDGIIAVWQDSAPRAGRHHLPPVSANAMSLVNTRSMLRGATPPSTPRPRTPSDAVSPKAAESPEKKTSGLRSVGSGTGLNRRGHFVTLLQQVVRWLVKHAAVPLTRWLARRTCTMSTFALTTARCVRCCLPLSTRI